jgi:hypothetical protein
MTANYPIRIFPAVFGTIALTVESWSGGRVENSFRSMPNHGRCCDCGSTTFQSRLRQMFRSSPSS